MLGVLAASLLAVYRVAGSEDASRHVPAHVTEADEAGRRAIARP
jgi:hypothetical protein